ncbi:hypothetical protein QJS04_geneDACA003019 [Acorus gramineus]|uniref:Uncharacterized protein n=1 Tax=Acorus gramineus TaxID=55184 RepID=A0AAV9BW31_ACOGR|nr:hypothetical protein QJS04_geneDACA003019 [Acorus gramineus]
MVGRVGEVCYLTVQKLDLLLNELIGVEIGPDLEIKERGEEEGVAEVVGTLRLVHTKKRSFSKRRFAEERGFRPDLVSERRNHRRRRDGKGEAAELLIYGFVWKTIARQEMNGFLVGCLEMVVNIPCVSRRQASAIVWMKMCEEREGAEIWVKYPL